jgi:hypothetical protein
MHHLSLVTACGACGTHMLEWCQNFRLSASCSILCYFSGSKYHTLVDGERGTLVMRQLVAQLLMYGPGKQ